MDSPIPVCRGVKALRRVLREQTCDLRELDEAGFRPWLERHLERWKQDAVFAQRVRIRDLRRSCPALAPLEQEYSRLADADAASSQFARLSQLDQELADTNRAIAGLTGALDRAVPERQPDLRRKLEAFRVQRQALEREQAERAEASSERQAVLRIERELRRLRAAIGLDLEEAYLATLLTERGRCGGRAGKTFEQAAVALAERIIVPDLLRHNRGPTARRVLVLQGVTLGAARLELDQLVVREPRRGGQPVEVLALVEAKRNINDLAHGFRQRQENLAWLTGETACYHPEDYRTRQFRTGHFDTEAVHNHHGETLVFTRRSFRRFRRDSDSGLYLDRLYFITRHGPAWGLRSAALERIGYRVATDEEWAPENEVYLRRLWRWGRSLANAWETPDVLRTYADPPRRGRQILFADAT